MKKSSLFFLALFIFYGFPVNAESPVKQTSQSQPAVKYSAELIRKTRERIENEPDYALKYFGTAYSILRAEQATVLAFNDLKSKLQKVESQMRDAIEAAPKLPDATAFFQSRDSKEQYFAIDGREIKPSSDAATKAKNFFWEDYLALYKDRKKYLSDRKELIEYWENTLKPTRQKLPDPDQLGLSDALSEEWREYKRIQSQTN